MLSASSAKVPASPPSSALALIDKENAHKGNLLSLYQKADKNSKEKERGSIFDEDTVKKYYAYLAWRQDYTHQNTPFQVGRSLDQLDHKLREIPFLDDCWVRILLKSIGLSDMNVVEMLKGSNEIQGSFQPHRMSWVAAGCKGNIPIFGYFSMVNPETGHVSYRLYSLEGDHNEVIPVSRKSTDLSFYGVGHLKYKSPLSVITSNGFLLDKNRQLIHQPGFFFYVSANGDICCNLYDYDPELKAMALFSLGGYSPDGDPEGPSFHQFAHLIKTAGGYDRVQEEGAVFLPHQSGDGVMTVSQAKVLLPYLYQLQLGFEEDKEKDNGSIGIDSGALALVIHETEQVIFEATYPKVKAIIEKEVEKEMEGRALEESKDSAPQPVHGKKEKHLKKQKVKHPVQKPQVDQRQVEALGRVKVLERIKSNFLKQAAEKRHLKTSEAEEILDQLKASLSKANIEQVDALRVRGSHAATAVTAQEGGSFYLGLVQRPEKQGFKSGTLRTIIKDYIDRSIQAILGTPRK